MAGKVLVISLKKMTEVVCDSKKTRRVRFLYCMMDRHTPMAIYTWVRVTASLETCSTNGRCVGHALNKIIKDMITRFHLLGGWKVK